MSQTDKPAVGTMAWIDLTVDDAEGIRDFYRDVVGWQPAPVEMGGYSDFTMNIPGTEDPTAGICHKRGTNAGLPSCWMVYITVADIEQSVARCRELGGEILVGPKAMGRHGRYCVIRDPAGAAAALIEPAS